MSILTELAFDDIFTYSRASVARYFGSSGYMNEAAVDEPRIDYNPTTGRKRGILMESGATNQLTRNQEFDNAAWTKTNCSITANNTRDPFNNFTMDRVNEGVFVSASATVAQTYGAAAAGSWAFSIYVKQGNSSNVGIAVGINAGADVYAFNFNFDSETITDTNTIGTPGLVRSGFQKLGTTGIYRLYIVLDGHTAGGISPAFFHSNSVTPTWSGAFGVPVYTAVGSREAYIWGALLEAGELVTSPIETLAAAATRAGDDLRVFSGDVGFASDGKGRTMVMEFETYQLDDTNTQAICGVSDGTGNDRWSSYIRGVNDTGLRVDESAGGTGVFLDTSPLAEETEYTLGWEIGSDTQEVYLDGVLQASGTNVNPIGMDRMDLGCNPGGGGQLYGWLRRVDWYTNDGFDLAGLTA